MNDPQITQISLWGQIERQAKEAATYNQPRVQLTGNIQALGRNLRNFTPENFGAA